MQQLNYATFSGEKIEFKQAYGETYDIVSKEIGGILDVLSIDDLDIWLDDEGLLKELEPTIIIKNSEKPRLTDQDILIVGPVVFASSDEEGETISLTDNAKEQLNKFERVFIGDRYILLYKNY